MSRFFQDGVRDGELIRDWMHQRFIELLRETGVEVCPLNGSYDQRFDRARRKIADLIR